MEAHLAQPPPPPPSRSPTMPALHVTTTAIAWRSIVRGVSARPTVLFPRRLTTHTPRRTSATFLTLLPGARRPSLLAQWRL